jgi:hypothetical protein
MRMYVILLCLFVCSCSSSTKITGSWTAPNANANRYQSVCVVSMSRNIEVRTKLENQLAAELGRYGLKVVKSTDIFPADFYQKLPSEDAILAKVRASGVDAILTESLINQQSETRYVPGSAMYSPYPAYGFYGGFYRYYGYWYPRIYDPGYYVTDKTYFLEANLFDAKTENLIWSAQSETMNPGSIDNFVNDYPKKLVTQLRKDGVVSK